MIELRTQGDRLYALAGGDTWWDLPDVYLGWRAAKRIGRRHGCQPLPPRLDGALRRIVGLPGEPAPRASDWVVYSAWKLGVPAREEVPV